MSKQLTDPKTAEPAPISIKELGRRLAAQGVEINYVPLTELLSHPEVAAILEIEKAVGRPAMVKPAVVDLLVRFIPYWRERKGTREQFATMLRDSRDGALTRVLERDNGRGRGQAVPEARQLAGPGEAHRAPAARDESVTVREAKRRLADTNGLLLTIHILLID